MSLTAHPYVVLAEQQWKHQSLSGANLAPHRGRPVSRLLGALRLGAGRLRLQRHTGEHRTRAV